MGYFDDLTPEGISGFALGDADLLGAVGLGGLDPYGLTRIDAARPGSSHLTEAQVTAFRQSLHGSLGQQKRAELAAYLKAPPPDNKVMRPPADAGKRVPPPKKPVPSSKAGLDAAWRDAIRESDAGQPRRARPSMLRDDAPDLAMTDEQIRTVFPDAPREVRIPYADPRRQIRILTDSLEGIDAKVARLPEGSVFVADDVVYRKGAGSPEGRAGDWRKTATLLSRRDLIKQFGPAEVKQLDRRMELLWRQQDRALRERVAVRMADRAPPAAIPPLRQSPSQQAIQALFGGNRRVPSLVDYVTAGAAELRRMTPAQRDIRQRRQNGRERWSREAEVADADPRSVVAKKWAQNLPQRAKTWLGGLMEWGAETNRQYQDFINSGTDLILDGSALRDAQYRRDVDIARRLRREGVEAIAANTPKFGSEIDRYAYEIGNGVVDLVGAIGVTALTRSPAAGSALLSAQVWGDRYGRSREAGRSHGEATMDAAVYSVAEFIPERLAIGKILKPGGTFAGRIVKGGSAQAIQETVTEAIQMGYDAGILKEDMSWGDAFQRLKDAAIIGGGSGGVVSGAVAPFRRGGSGQPATGDRIDRYPPIARVEQGIASSLDNANAPPVVWIEPEQRGSGPPTAAAGDIAGQPAPSVSIEGRQAVIRGADPDVIADIEAGLPKGTRALRRSDGAFVLPQRYAEDARAVIAPAPIERVSETTAQLSGPRTLQPVAPAKSEELQPPFNFGGIKLGDDGVDLGNQTNRLPRENGQIESKPLDRQTVGDLFVDGGWGEAGDGEQNVDPITMPNVGATSGAQLLLPYTKTTDTLQQVRRRKAADRWRDGERYILESHKAKGQQHFPVPEAAVNGEQIKGGGGRNVDAIVKTSNGGVVAIEVKTYKKWRTVNGSPEIQYVPLSSEIRNQLLKDIWLRDNGNKYDPRWVFLDAEPSGDLINFMNKNGIIYIIYK